MAVKQIITHEIFSKFSWKDLWQPGLWLFNSNNMYCVLTNHVPLPKLPVQHSCSDKELRPQDIYANNRLMLTASHMIV